MNNLPILPEQASTFAEKSDSISLVLTTLTIFFSVLVMVLLVIFAVHFRRGSRANRKNPQHHNMVVELAWSMPPLFLGLAMFAWSVKPYAEVFNPPSNAEEIFVVGKRWMWHIQHVANGIRENNELHVPTGRPFKLTITSQDVIHGFYIPDFRLKRDAMPGRYNTLWFQATKPGKYHLFCSEFCGTDHSQMGGWVYVMTPADYDTWARSELLGRTLVPAMETPEQSGFELYTQLACGNCHKTEDSVRAPSLYSLYGKTRQLQDGTTVKADDLYLHNAIKNPENNLLVGYSPTMPSYKDNLDELQIHDLIMYIKSLGNTTVNQGSTPTTTPPIGATGGTHRRRAPHSPTGSNTQ